MRKMIAIALAIVALAIGSANADPRADGEDVTIPDQDGLIQTIPDLTERPVLAATDINGWFVRGSKYTSASIIEATTMRHEGNEWRAVGMRGKRFHPVQLGPDGKPKWALIEEVYPLESEFVDTSNKEGPCLLVK